MHKPFFFLIAACSSLFIRIPAEIAINEKLPLVLGDTGQAGKIAAKIGGIFAIVGATSITFHLMQTTMPNGKSDIDYKNALNPRRNKLIWLHFLLSTPILATVFETETSLLLKLTGSIPRIVMDTIITKNIIEGTIKTNREFFQAWRQNGWLTLKFAALLTIAAPLWLGLGAGTAKTASVALAFDEDSTWFIAFRVLGSLSGIPFGSTIAHASINNWSNPSTWSVTKAKDCQQKTKQVLKNAFALLFTFCICSFYGLLAESGISILTNKHTVKNLAFAYLHLISLAFIQPSVNNILSIVNNLFSQRSLHTVTEPVTIIGEGLDDDIELAETATATHFSQKATQTPSQHPATAL